MSRGPTGREGNTTVTEVTAHDDCSIFSGLKIIITCYERVLLAEWHRIAMCIKGLGQKGQGKNLNTYLAYSMVLTAQLLLHQVSNAQGVVNDSRRVKE